MNYSIRGFWVDKFNGVGIVSDSKPLAGWEPRSKAEPSYVQANLSLRDEHSDLSQKVWLVGAPGAVGKSTLAKQICAVTGAVYLDLAAASTVAGNYVVGGLVYTKILSAFQEGTAALVIDALDEARLRVTQSGFEAFLADVAAVASMGSFPVIVLGRVGIVEEAWVILNEVAGMEPPIFDIELFDACQSEEFVHARLRAISEEVDADGGCVYPHLKSALAIHGSVYKDVVCRVVSGLQGLSAGDGNRFSGYAPVLDAVAKVIAAESNPSKIGEEIQRVMEGQVLTRLSQEVLIREQGKLVTQLQSQIPDLPEGLYEPGEQLVRLGARLFSMQPPPFPSMLQPHQQSSYEQAVDNLLPQHPFLDGTGLSPSSSVFAASILAAALKSGNLDFVKAAERYVTSSSHTANPFLYEFYREEAGSSLFVPAEHVGLIFESVLARSKPGEVVRLGVEDGSDHSRLTVEILIAAKDESSARIELEVPSSGVLRFGRRVAGVTIDAEGAVVEIGGGDQVELIAPVFISCKSIGLICSQIVVKSDSKTGDSVVVLEADQISVDSALTVPVVRQGAQLQVTWPDAAAYPWTQFAAPASKEENPKTGDALRALRRLVMAFRSHSKGRLARYKGKIEHQRMMKGAVGEAVLGQLLKDSVITLEGAMYYLDADELGAVVGASYADVNLKRYSDRTRDYVRRAIGG